MSTPAASDQRAEPVQRFPATRLALAMAILGTVGAFTVQAGLDPMTTVFWRCVFGSVFLGVWCACRGYLAPSSLRPGLLLRAVPIGICVVLSWLAFFASFPLTSIATTTIVYHVQPFFVVLLGVIFYRDRLSADQAIWMGIAFTGVAFASGLLTSSGHAITTQWLTGIALSLAAALMYAVATILAKSLAAQQPAVTALCQTVIGIVMLAPFAHIAQPVSMTSWAWLLGIGGLHTGVAYVLMYSALPHLKAPVIGGLTFIYPLVAILIDWLVYAHPIQWPQALGMAMIAMATLGIRLGWPLLFRTASRTA